MAPQLMATNGWAARGLSSCTARASSSLPVPLSPSSSTVTLVGATRSMVRFTFCMESLPVTMRRSGVGTFACASCRFSSSNSDSRRARSTTVRSTSISIGFSQKS